MVNGLQAKEKTTHKAVVRNVPISSKKMLKEFVELERKGLGKNKLSRFSFWCD